MGMVSIVYFCMNEYNEFKLKKRIEWFSDFLDHATAWFDSRIKIH